MSDYDPWETLRQATSARIALGRSGGSLPTREVLAFRLAHARAKDAVLCEFDPEALALRLRKLGTQVLCVESDAKDKAEYLRRPDLGRRLSPTSLVNLSGVQSAELVIVVSDGLSTPAADSQAEPLLAELLPLLAKDGWRLAPLVVAKHGRVALQDPIGEAFQATLSLILIGERPGLSSADSLGAYLTHGPQAGRSDADRNCLSNIRPGGLSSAEAAAKLRWLLNEARRRGLSGVALKDETEAAIDVGLKEQGIP